MKEEVSVRAWVDTVYVGIDPSAHAALIQSVHLPARTALLGHNLDRTVNLREKD